MSTLRAEGAKPDSIRIHFNPLREVDSIQIYIYQEYVYASCLAPDIYWKNSMNNHVMLKGVDVEVMKVIQLASEVHN